MAYPCGTCRCRGRGTVTCGTGVARAAAMTCCGERGRPRRVQHNRSARVPVALEDDLFDSGADIHRRGFALRRTRIRLRRVIAPMRELLAELERDGRAELVTDRLRPYFQDVNDHALRAIEGVDAARDLIASALDTNYAEKGDQLNEITKKLLIVGLAGYLYLTLRKRNWL